MGSSGSCEMNSVKSNGRKHEEMALIQIDGSKTEDWIKKIKKKECAHFVSRTDREEVCHCGKAKREHKLENNDPTEPEWIPEKHIIEMPTDAFGDLTFKGFGNKTAKYVRASDSTPPEVLYEMMRTQWQLKAPNLLITVTGGASYFHMPPWLEKLFSQGLVEAARSTGAWIFTGGCHAGVAKLVGEAMPDFSQSGRGHHEIVTIGIAPWGTIYNRDGLIKNEWGCPDEYNLVVTNQDCLDDNHSHFILVDDGTQGRYGVEIPLRTKLEQVIPELTMKEGVDMKIPIVCVVLAGNLNTLDIVHSYVTNYTPCVIVEGSKGFADVIAQVADMDPSKITFNLIKEKLQFTLQVNGSPEKILECTKKIEDIVRMRQLLTIFRADKGSTQGMDFTMALLKASQSMDSKNLVYQLYLAVLWNRLDIAKNEIFNGKGSLKPKDLYPALTVALIENRTDFVQLLLKQGVRLRDYVSPETLKYLYDNIKSDTLFCQKLEKIKKDLHENLEVFTLHHIEKALKSLCNFTGSLNFTTEPQTPVTSQSTPFTDCQAPQKMDYPIQDLLIWAVVQNRGELAKILWTECQDWIAGALTCRKILRALYKEETDTNNADKIKALADRFEERATGVFSECYREDEGRAEQLLTRCSPDWGYTTCLQLAWNDEKSFMINSGVQKIMSKIWWGELSENNSLFRLLICMVFFPLIYTNCITFRQESGTLSPLQRLRAFVTAPVVVFYFNVVSYIGFLWLFAYVLLMDFQDTPSWTEYLLYVWVFSLFCEEVRQLNYYHGKVTFMTRSSIYITDFWNLMDVMAIILFLVGQVCRRITVSLYAGRVILAVDFIIFCLRLMHLFIVNKFLGPKIIMMKGMIMDIASFLFLLTVWVVSFGVSKQVILVHNEERLDWIFRSVIYQPFLTLFGQLPTDMDKLNFDNSTCSADGSDETLPKCAETLDGVPLFPEWLTIILLCLYLLFAGLLLINLLIAMFSHTFSEVQSNTDMLWKVHQYKLINEYRKRPSLPPPFNLLRILGTLVKKVNCKKQDQGHEGQQRNGSSVFFWEEEMKSKYLLQQQESQDQRSDLEIKDISKKVDALTKSLESEQKRASMMEQQVSQSLDWIMKSLTEKGLASEEKAPVMEHLKSIEAEKPTTGDKTKYYKKSEYHVHSRQLMYPGSNVQRFPVPHELVPWKVDFDCYFPPSYIAEKEGRETHNPWMEAAGSQPKNEYPVGEDHPPNPEGRTGIKGLGSLMWYGPNHSLHLVLTRWKSDEYKLFVWKGGKKVLEVLAVKREGSERWGLPGGRLRPDEKLPSTLKAILKEESWEMFEALLEKRTEGRLRPDEKLPSTLKAILNEESWKMFEALLEKRTEVHNGYQDDPRNTDDAWVVLRAVSAHLESPEDLTFLESNLCTLESADSICWLMVDEKMPLYANMKDILREVARKLNAHY